MLYLSTALSRLRERNFRLRVGTEGRAVVRRKERTVYLSTRQCVAWAERFGVSCEVMMAVILMHEVGHLLSYELGMVTTTTSRLDKEVLAWGLAANEFESLPAGWDRIRDAAVATYLGK